MLNLIIPLIEEQETNNNYNKRYIDYGKQQIIKDVEYCLNIARLLLAEVLNKHYYPLLTDENINYIIDNLANSTVINVLFPYYPDSTFINKFIHNQQKKLDNYYAENYLLYLHDKSTIFNNMINYLNHLFININ